MREYSMGTSSRHLEDGGGYQEESQEEQQQQQQQQQPEQPGLTPRVLTRSVIAGLSQGLDASDVLECYALVRPAALHGIASSSVKINKMVLGLRYRQTSSNGAVTKKDPLELTLEYGPQRIGPLLSHEAMPFININENDNSAGIAWENVAKVYYTTVIPKEDFTSAYYMASMTGAVLEPILTEAVEYAEKRRRYQPFSVYSTANGKELRSSSSSDFMSFIWHQLATLGVEVEPILAPPVYEARLWVDGIEKVIPEPHVALSAATFYQKLYRCIEAIATGDYSAYSLPPTSSPTLRPTYSESPSFAPTSAATPTASPIDERSSNNDESNQEDKDDDNVHDEDDDNIQNEDDDNVQDEDDDYIQDDDDDNIQDDDDDSIQDEEVQDDDVIEDKTIDQDSDDLKAEDDDNGDENEYLEKEDGHAPEKSPKVSMNDDAVDNDDFVPLDDDDEPLYFEDEDDESSYNDEDESGDQRSRRRRKIRRKKPGGNSRRDEKSGEGELTDMPSTAPSTNQTADENQAKNDIPSPDVDVETAKQAAQEAQVAADEAKEAAQTEGETKAADAAQAAANAAQKAADATSNAASQAAMGRLHSGDGALMSSTVSTCFSNPQYGIASLDDNGTLTSPIPAYLYRDGSLYYKLNLTSPFFEIVKIDQPIPKVRVSNAYGSGGDFVDWTLALAVLGSVILGTIVILQQAGFRFFAPLYKCQRWYFHPRRNDDEDRFDINEDINWDQNVSAFSFGEDAIPLSMGGRRTTLSPIQQRSRSKSPSHTVLDDFLVEHLGFPSLSSEEKQRKSKESPSPRGDVSNNGGIRTWHGSNSNGFGDVEMNRLAPRNLMRSESPSQDSMSSSYDDGMMDETNGGEIPDRLKRDPDLVDLPHLISRSKVAVPVGVACNGSDHRRGNSFSSIESPMA